ncbi:unnamed protein product [Blumeria hordei]|uniref:Uncharacterized protein n=2 Tax=Blumeria hordei TaxID=2867405 RepID=A0A383UN27_BLUHO|nr:unnamed protein product [Blumeria hordei]
MNIPPPFPYNNPYMPHDYKINQDNPMHTRPDPDCAICDQPAVVQCDCEATVLETLTLEAEHKVMGAVYSKMRDWVNSHARDYVLNNFYLLADRRKESHMMNIQQLTLRAAHIYNAMPHPSDIAYAEAEYKRGVDADWKTSCLRYPEVLEYFYGLVNITLPSENDKDVREPPLRSSSLLRRKRMPKIRQVENMEDGDHRRRRHSRTRERPNNEHRRHREREREREPIGVVHPGNVEYGRGPIPPSPPRAYP